MAETIYRCVLLDDELLALSYLRTLCENIPEIEVVKAFDQPQNFLDEISQLNFDICVSDIVMPGLTGLEVAKHLGKKPVIFTTAHNEYAADAFDVEAIDFLRKPVQAERLQRAIQKAIQYLELQKRSINWQVTTAKGKMSFAVSTLVSFSANTLDRRDKLLLLSDGTSVVVKNKSFEQLISELQPAAFIRISKSEMIQQNFIQGYQGDLIFSTLSKEGKPLAFSLSENYRKSVIELFKKT